MHDVTTEPDRDHVVVNHNHADRVMLHSDCPACNVVRAMGGATFSNLADARAGLDDAWKAPSKQGVDPHVLRGHLHYAHVVPRRLIGDGVAAELLHLALHETTEWAELHYAGAEDLHREVNWLVRPNPHREARARQRAEQQARQINNQQTARNWLDAQYGVSGVNTTKTGSISWPLEVDTQDQVATEHKEAKHSHSLAKHFAGRWVENIEVAVFVKHPVVVAEAMVFDENGNIGLRGHGIACKRPEDRWNERLGIELATGRALRSLGVAIERNALAFEVQEHAR